MLNIETKRAEYKNSDPEYGDLFEEIYSDGVIDGRIDGRITGRITGIADGIIKGKLEVTENLLKNGVDEEIISLNTGLPLDEIKNIKRKL